MTNGAVYAHSELLARVSAARMITQYAAVLYHANTKPASLAFNEILNEINVKYSVSSISN